jgi:hypothetical protein
MKADGDRALDQTVDLPRRRCDEPILAGEERMPFNGGQVWMHRQRNPGLEIRIIKHTREAEA